MNIRESQPRVLILNQPFVDNTGGGITLSNLFSRWKREKLAVACSGYLLTQDMDPSVCNNYYQLGSEERKWIFPFNLFGRKYYSGPININDRANNKNKIIVEKSKFRVKLILDYIFPVFDYIGVFHFQAKTKLSSSFCKWLDDFDPDVLYAQASSLENILFCLEIKKYTGKPLVFHMMDDWPSTIARRGFMKKYWTKKIINKLKELLDHTDVALSISDYMAQEYKRRYDKDFITFHNPINIEFWKSAQKNNYMLNDTPVLLYAGRVGLGIDKSLKTIAQAVDRVNQRLGLGMKFVIQAGLTPDWIKNYDCVVHRSFVSYQELPMVFSKADLLILPYDFSFKSISFIKYSMPTKASEYMASGTPILIYAPQDTALVQYAQRYDWAMVIGENNMNKLADKLEKLLTNENLRRRIGQKAKIISEKRHDANNVALNFQKIISSVVDT